MIINGQLMMDGVKLRDKAGQEDPMMIASGQNQIMILERLRDLLDYIVTAEVENDLETDPTELMSVIKQGEVAPPTDLGMNRIE